MGDWKAEIKTRNCRRTRTGRTPAALRLLRCEQQTLPKQGGSGTRYAHIDEQGCSLRLRNLRGFARAHPLPPFCSHRPSMSRRISLRSLTGAYRTPHDCLLARVPGSFSVPPDTGRTCTPAAKCCLIARPDAMAAPSPFSATQFVARCSAPGPFQSSASSSYIMLVVERNPRTKGPSVSATKTPFPADPWKISPGPLLEPLGEQAMRRSPRIASQAR